MPLYFYRLICGLFEMKAAIIDVSGTELSKEEAAFFKAEQPWAFILFGRSCQNPQQIKKLCDDIRESVGRDCLIFLDQEGGRVQRLKPPLWPQFPPNKIYGDIFNKNPDDALEAAYLHHALIAAELRAVGINADCAPCLDLSIEGAHSVIGDRAFSTNPEIIARLGQASLSGLHDGKVASVIKHIPGHGRARADSHKELPVVGEDLETLKADFLPFKALNQAPMAMTAHVKYNAIDKEHCATMSKTIINDYIRDDFGFDGLLMTDDISMKALQGSISEKAKGVIEAGCDVAMLCNAPLEERAEFLAVCPELKGKSLERAYDSERIVLGEPITLDLDAAWNRFSELTGVAKGAMLALNPDPTERG